MHAFQNRKPIPNYAEDLERLNQALLGLLTDPSKDSRVQSFLEVSGSVAKRISEANGQGLVTASRCGVPLVIFTSVFEGLLSTGLRGWARTGRREVPHALEELTFFALNFAHQVVLRDLSVAHAFFGLSRTAAETFADMPVVHRETLSRRGQILLKARAGSDLAVWGGLLIGDRCGDGRGHLIARVSGYRTLFQM